jgi:hypothetical protein
MKFKVGDKVKFKDKPYLFKILMEDTYGFLLEDLDVSPDCWKLSNSSVWTHEHSIKAGTMIYNEYGQSSDLELAKYKYTRLAEKLFPKGHKEGDWWILD